MSLFPPYAVSELAGLPRSKGSKVFVVDYVNGSDSNTGLKWESPLKTVEAAFALCTTLKNDVVLLVGNGSSNVAAAAIDWSKSYVHLIGLSAPGLMEPRSRIKPTAALATTPFFTISGSGCIFKNISFWHETSDAIGLVNVSIIGGRNYFEDCQLAGAIGANAVTGSRSLMIAGTNGGNTFKRCMIGNDTVMVPNGGASLELVTGAMHNRFMDCIFSVSTNGTTYAHVLAAAAAGVGRMNVFERCLFTNQGNGVMAQVVSLGAALPVSSYLYFLNCWKYGIADWDHNNRGVLSNVTIAANTTGDNSGNTMIITSG